jgi:hypothetical protein
VPTDTPIPPPTATIDFGMVTAPPLTVTVELPIAQRGESLFKPSARALDFTAWLIRR